HVAIARIDRQHAIELGDRLLDPARGVQRDGVHITEADVARLQLRGTAQFRQRLVTSLEADECQSERVSQAGVGRRARESRSQYLLRLVVTRLPGSSQDVSEIRVRRREE